MTKKARIKMELTNLTVNQKDLLLSLLLNEVKGENYEHIGKYVIVRTYSAGVHAGELVRKDGKEVELHNARRIYRWAGAATLSQLALDGTKLPGDCKFPAAVDRITLTEAIEIIPCTSKARDSIKGVWVWEK